MAVENVLKDRECNSLIWSVLSVPRDIGWNSHSHIQQCVLSNAKRLSISLRWKIRTIEIFSFSLIEPFTADDVSLVGSRSLYLASPNALKKDRVVFIQQINILQMYNNTIYIYSMTHNRETISYKHTCKKKFKLLYLFHCELYDITVSDHKKSNAIHNITTPVTLVLTQNTVIQQSDLCAPQ